MTTRSRYVLGFTCLNDVTARDLQKKDGQFTRAKSFDTFCPIGPFIETDIELDQISVTTRVNGEVRQDGRTSQMVFPVDFLIRYISNMMTLDAGRRDRDRHAFGSCKTRTAATFARSRSTGSAS